MPGLVCEYVIERGVMELLELILFLLAAIVVSSLLDQIVRGVSLPLVQIALGAAIASAFPLSLSEGIDFELLFVLFIAPLHFNESRHVDSGELWRNRFGIASLTTGLVLLTMAAVGFSLHALVPAIPLAACLAVGAAMGSSDATAVTSLAKEFRFGKRHEALLNGEALLNDVVGTVGFQCAIGVAATGAFSLAHAGEEFALDLFGGMLAGAVLGVALWALFNAMRRFGIDNPTVHVVLELLAPFLIYLICEEAHLGGVIAVVFAGMMMSLLPQSRTALTARQRMQSASVWKTIEFILSGVIFVVLGMQLSRVLALSLDGAGDLAGYIAVVLAITLVLESARFLWILGMDMVDASRRGLGVRSRFGRQELKSTLAMTFAGPKGGVTLALVLTIPLSIASGEAFPYRSELLSIASGVILCTLLLANFALRLLAPRKAREKRSRPYIDAEIMLLERVIGSIQADSHLTGAVKGDGVSNAGSPDRSEGDRSALREDRTTLLPQDVDEPATAIVMKRYADRIREVARYATSDVARRGLALADRCDELYHASDAIADALRDIEEDEGNDAEGLSAHVMALSMVREAVVDIQDQALARELEYIKSMRRAGELSPAHARELRNDVYVQQMVEG